ncbi:5'-nucleotidase [Terribacillus halophilus]|uniref:5'-nucleotidase SurE n=1 Tax=Terribacillus halophilus TaxID=361279 RepID=A0A1G6PUP5_9BACI|nr:5'/3'-nucleotidase SurE [Terribacillus halophilus]SDC83117.1 5'-nucleotidase [Terribacillus halophilus]
MKIMVTNEDGIFSPGVEAMIETLQHFGEVYVVCPDQEYGTFNHSITVRQPIRVKEMYHFPGVAGAWSLNGTPADCVKLGVEVLLPEKPDFLFSGVNTGPNLGRDVYYSGTMAAAVEATLYNIPAASVSLNSSSLKHVNYSKVKTLFYQVAEVLLQHKTKSVGFLNINLPNIDKRQFKGIQVIPMDMSVSRYRFVGLHDPHGEVYYWLKDQLQELAAFHPTSDYLLLKEGYITVSPIELRTHYKRKQEQVERWFRSMETNTSE